MERNEDFNRRCLAEHMIAYVSAEDKLNLELNALLLGMSKSEYMRALTAIPVQPLSFTRAANRECGEGVHRITLLTFTKRSVAQLNYQTRAWMHQRKQAIGAIEAISNRRNIADYDSLRLGRKARELLDDIEEYRLSIAPLVRSIAERMREKREPYDAKVKWRLSAPEKERLQERAAKLGIASSDLMRILIRLPSGFARAASGGGRALLTFDTESLNALVALVRDWGRILNKSVHALNTIHSKKAIPARDALKLYEGAVANLEGFDAYKQPISSLLGYIADAELVQVGRR